MKSYIHQLTKPIYVEVPQWDYTSEGTEYKYEGGRVIELKAESAIEFGLKIQGLENDLNIELFDLIVWKDGSKQEVLSGEQENIVYSKIQSLIQTNLS